MAKEAPSMDSYSSSPSEPEPSKQASVVRKRDGQTQQPFESDKIVAAIRGAWREARSVDPDDIAIRQVVNRVSSALPLDPVVDVEAIQDIVELCLMRAGFHDVAKAYILYRSRRAEARASRKKPDSAALADYIHLSKYSRYRPELGRRELHEETVQRVEDMHTRRFPELAEDIRWAFDFVREKKVLPSMRSMQFGGQAMEAVNARGFNCSYTLIDRPRVFAEVLYLLLCGCGVGFSVQFDHVEKLPPLSYVDENQVVHHSIEDTIEGWSNALDALVNGHIEGKYIEFDYSKIRPIGALLKTSGGRAPGHLQLKKSLEAIREIFNGAAGRKLRPIEAYDCLCHAASAVLSGGIRRSAMIALFSYEDGEMMNAKTGNWYPKTPWRENSNNSVALIRGSVTEKQFKRVFEATRQFGEPGFIFLNDIDHGYNPCAEIGLYPVLETPEGKKSGFAFCNLTSLNLARLTTTDEFVQAAKAATIIGTVQASYTSMPYLGPVSEAIADRDALLGISMTGMLDNPTIACDPTLQRETAEQIKSWNAFYANKIGIKAAARTTCVKPEGTGSLSVGGVASGHHPHHARRYFRRVTAAESEPVFQFFKATNPHMCIKKPSGSWTIEFCVEAPPGATVKDDVGAIEFLEMVRSTQQNWVVPGTARDDEPVLHHNVSNTIHVKPHEWASVEDYLWKNQKDFSAVSLLSYTGDKDYAFAPYEAITTDADEARWNAIVSSYTPVDYAYMFEDEDVTSLKGEAACAGGACEVKF